MEQFKCKNCGGVLDARSDSTKCIYCGSRYEIAEQFKSMPKKQEDIPLFNSFTRPVKKIRLITLASLTAFLTFIFLITLLVDYSVGILITALVVVLPFYVWLYIEFKNYKIKNRIVKVVLCNVKISLAEICKAIGKDENFFYQLKILLHKLMSDQNITGYVLTNNSMERINTKKQ